MLGGLLFRLVRIFEITTLIPVLGMLAWFVSGYTKQNQLTPDYILVLFIVSVIATVWAVATLFRVDSVRRNAPFVAFIDLCIVGGLIAGVYYLRAVTGYDCVNVTGGVSASGGTASQNGNTVVYTSPSINFSPFGVSANNTCAMLKASFAFGIINILNFATTFWLVCILHRREQTVVVEKTYRSRGSHSSRRGHRSTHRSSSRDSRRNYYV